VASIHGIPLSYHDTRGRASYLVFGMPRQRPVLLMILDGFGERAEKDDNAIRLATTPTLDALHSRYPCTTIGTSGPDVGLPPGQMGNSEVGHLNFGAGRIAMMDISRIDNAVHDGTLANNPVLVGVMRAAKETGGRLHLLGLTSDGGVHSSLDHLLAVIDAADAEGVGVVVHAFLDGRDVQPGTAPAYLARVEAHLSRKTRRTSHRGCIGTVSGRYWAMDRDNRWERVARAYDAIVVACAPRFASAEAGVTASLEKGTTDEFVEPFVVGDYAGVDVTKDAALHTNFRPDRARELTRALATADFTAFPRSASPPFHAYACMTTYDTTLELPVAFTKEAFADTFPEVISRAGLRQFRCAETEKYAHVTYFFNGGVETPFVGEDRKMIPSPRDVATYDQKPEMSAQAVADAVVDAVASEKYDFILVNFANPDMVGHTGLLPAAIRAVEEVDTCIGRVADAVRAKGGCLLVTADHGNCELMRDPATGKPHTAHTTNRVPLLYVSERDRNEKALIPNGRICDVAPTMLELLGLPQPAAMTGHSLLRSAEGAE
jgi:2,3-bisphosphoglycerate-independent phosphoglycerate mutase